MDHQLHLCFVQDIPPPPIKPVYGRVQSTCLGRVSWLKNPSYGDIARISKVEANCQIDQNKKHSLCVSNPYSLLNQTHSMISATTAMYLDDLRIVKSIHDGRGISGAVRLLKINHSTISRRLAAMEASLDTQLFERRRSGYLPTQAGVELIQLAERVEKDVTGVLHRLSILSRGHRGMLRVTTSDALAHSLLTPIIADFRKLNPEMTIDVTIGNRSLSLVRGECDVAIRTTLCPADNLFGRKVSTMHWALYGKPSPRKHFQYPSQMQEENWVSFNDTLSELKAFSFVEQHIPAENVVYRTNSIAAAASAIAQGMGIGLLPCVLADSVEGISRIGPIENDIFDEIWILTHPELRKAKPIRAFMKYCADAISAHDNASHTHAHDA